MGDIQDEDVPQLYSQEEINQAREDIKNMTPEDLLSLRGALDRAIANISLPEATAICFTEIYTSSGNKVNITARGTTARYALDELADGLRYAAEMYNMYPANKVSNEPRYVPAEQDTPDADAPLPYAPSTPAPQYSQGQIIDMRVDTISRERKRDGKGDFLKVKGGMYTKFGVAAYDNVYPKTFDITKLTYGVEITPPPEMQNAKVNTTKPGVKVVQFYP